MKKILQWISQGIQRPSMTEEEKYLSQATSLEDLEWRQKNLMYGQAPYQQQYRMHLNSYYAGMEAKR